MAITNNEAINDMFSLAVKDGYRRSKEDFQELMASDGDALNDVFNLASQNGYNGDLNQFSSLMGLETLPEKKNQDGTGSLDGGLFPEYKPNIQDQPIPDLGETLKGWWNTIKDKGITGAAMDVLMEQDDKRTGYDPRIPDLSPDQQSSNLMADADLREAIAKKQDVANKNLLKLRETPDYIETLKSINSNIFTDNDARGATEVLRSLIGDYGFDVSMVGKDKVNIMPTNGNDYVEVSTTDFNLDDLINLQKSFSANATAPKQMDVNTPLIDKAIAIKNSREVPRLTEDRMGNVEASTVKLASFEMDGKHYAAPTLYPKDGFVSSRPDAWLELDPKRDIDLIIELAKKNDELIPFDTQEEAEEFAQGSWKTINTADREKRNYFIKQGVEDYDVRNQVVNNYNNLRNEYQLIMGGDGFFSQVSAKNRKTKATPTEMSAYPNLFNKEGYMRNDADKYAKELKSSMDVLYERAYGDKNFRDVQRNWDVVAEKNRQQFIANSSSAIEQSDFAFDEIDKYSLQQFKVPFAEINTYIPKNDTETKLIQFLTEADRRAQDVRQYALQNFIIGKTYLDGKANKGITGEVVDGIMNNIANEYYTRYPRGKAAEVILELAAYQADPGFKKGDAMRPRGYDFIGFESRDIANSEDRRIASELVSKYLSQSILASEGQGRTMLDFAKARGWRESAEVFSDSPMELALSVFSGSISEMLPYGAKIIPVAALAGGGAGLVTTGNVPGGLLLGAQGGMAGSILGMEYSNAIFESMEDLGYDIFNPKSVERALSDANVWEEGQSKGLARGIPIAIIDFMSARLAGRIFSATKGMNPVIRTGALVGERGILDPGAEALGETLAQINNAVLNGVEMNGGDIALEAIGGFGGNMSNMVANLAVQGMMNQSKKAAEAFASYSPQTTLYPWNVTLDDTPLLPDGTTNWTNNLVELNIIDENTGQAIQKRIGAQRDAMEILRLNSPDKAPGADDVQSAMRLTQLLNAKNLLTTNEVVKDAYSPVLASINEEIKDIALKGKWDTSMTKVGAEIFQKLFGTESPMFPAIENTVVEEEEGEFDKALDAYKGSDLGGGMEGDSSEKNKLIEITKKLPKEEQEKLKERFLKANPDTEIDENGDIVVYRVGSIREGATPMTTSKRMAEIIANERAEQGLSSTITKTKVKPKDVALFVPGSEAEVIVDVTPENIESIDDVSEEVSEGKSLKELEKELAELEKALANTNEAIEEGTSDMLPAIIDNKPKLERKIKNLQRTIISKKGDANKKLQTLIRKRKKTTTKEAATSNVKQELQDKIKSIEDERDGDIEEVQEEISSVKIDLKNDLKQPGLTKIEKLELREDAKATLDDLKFDISQIKAEARKAISQAKKAAKDRTPKAKKAEEEVTTYSAEEAKLAQDLEDGTFFKQARNQYAIDKLADDYGMNNEGYMNNVDNPSRLIKEGESLGITVRKSRGPGYVFYRDGSFYNPKADPDFGKRDKQRPQMKVEDQKQLLRLLSIAFPTIKVVIDQKKFDDEIKKPEIQRRIVRGYVVYGFNRNNKTIFINPNDTSFEIAIHEFAHPWLDYLASPLSGEQGTRLLRQGIKLVQSDGRGKNYYDEAKRTYGNVKTKEGYELAAIEALADYIAEEGGRFSRKVEGETQPENAFLKWIKRFWAYIKKWLSGTFKKNKQGNRESTIPVGKELEQMTLQRFANMALGDLLGGQEVNPKFNPEEFSQGTLFSQQQEGLSFDSDLGTIIQQARERGIPDASIRKVLKDRIKFAKAKYTAADVDALMSFTLEEGRNLPVAFGDMVGGVFAGLSLFRDVKNAVENFIGERGILEDVRNEYAESLRIKYPELKTQNTSTILRKYPLSLKKGEVLKKKSEVRRFAKEYLQDSVLFKQQPKNIQQKLIVALDKDLKITAGKEITAEIKELKKLITERKRAVRDINSVKNDLVRYIRLNFPDETDTTKTILRRLTKLVADVATPDDYMAAVERVLQTIEEQNDKTKKALINSIYKILNVGGTPAKTVSSQVRSRGVDAETGLYMQQAKKILKAVITDDIEVLESIRYELAEKENEIQAALLKDRTGEKLSLEENKLLALTAAFDMFADIKNLSLDEVRDILEDIKAGREVGRSIFAENRLRRVNEINQITNKFTEEIKNKLAPFLFTEDGEVKNQDRINEDYREIWQGLQDAKYNEAFKKLLNELIIPISKQPFNALTATFKSLIGITYNYMNALDAGKTKVFTDDIYYRLAEAEENAQKNFFRYMDRVEEIAAEIFGKEKVDASIIVPFVNKTYQSAQLGEISAYEYLKQLATLKDRFDVPGVNTQRPNAIDSETGLTVYEAPKGILKNLLSSNRLTVPQLMYIYAQWQNPKSKEMLIQDGFTQRSIDAMVEYMGEDLKNLVDRVLEAFTYEFFDEYNDVFVEENQVNLEQEFPYFPRKSEKRIKTKESERETFSEQGFVRNFQNINPSAVSLRATNTANLRIRFSDFFAVLESHLEEMSRYMAYSKVVKIMDAIVNTPAVSTYLDVLLMRGMVSRAINNAIHPKGYLSVGEKFNNSFSLGFERFTSFALALKVVQLPKQASSFYNGFILFNQPKFDVFNMPKKAGDPMFKDVKNLESIGEDIAEGLKQIIGGTANESIQLVKFTQAYINLLKNKKETIKRAEALSAQFRARRKEALGGRMYALTTGQESVELTPELRKLSESFKLVNKAFGYFTTEGDLLGVLGYLVAYDNAIENGMSPEEALLLFNDYNLTQQSRRGLDKNALQTGTGIGGKMLRGLTMFSSSLFLALNQTLLATNNITRGIKNNTVVSRSEYRRLFINLIIVQALFATIGSLPLLLAGDRKDREKALDRILTSPLNIFRIIPYLGQALQTFANSLTGEQWKERYNRGITNPFSDILDEIGTDISNGEYMEVPETILQFMAGVQFRPAKGLARLALGQGEFWYNFLTMMGYGDGSIPQRWVPQNKALRDDIFINKK